MNKPLAAVYVAEIEQKHVFPLVFDTAFATHLRVFFVYKTHIQLAFVHTRQPETKRQRLNPIVVFAAQPELQPSKSRKVRVARGVDKKFCLYIEITRNRGNGYKIYFSVFNRYVA